MGQLKDVPSGLSSLKSKMDKLYIGKLETTPADLSKLSNVVKNEYFTTQEFNKLISNNFTERLKQANLASKSDIADFVKRTDFDNTLISFYKRITSNKTKDIEFKTKLGDLEEKV